MVTLSTFEHHNTTMKVRTNRLRLLLTVLVVTWNDFSFGFSPQDTPKPSSSSSTSLQVSNAQHRPDSLAAAKAELNRVPYGEESRKYRRTVFTHDDWVKHRNSKRLFANLSGIFMSGLLRQLKTEVLLVTAIAASVVVWNDAVVTHFTDWPMITLPTVPFTLSSSPLGLLLVFRTNASYARWTEARRTWGVMTTQCVNVARMTATYTSSSSTMNTAGTHTRVVSEATWLLCRSLMNQLLGAQDDDDFEQEVRLKIFDKSLCSRILSTNDKVTASLMHLSLQVDKVPTTELRRIEIDKSLVQVGDLIGACARIFKSPVPLVYTRHTARFLSLWMLLLPSALYEPFRSASTSDTLLLIPAVAMLAVFLFGIEELAIQLEEPFSILPLQDLCDGVWQKSRTMVDWAVSSEKQEQQD